MSQLPPSYRFRRTELPIGVHLVCDDPSLRSSVAELIRPCSELQMADLGGAEVVLMASGVAARDALLNTDVPVVVLVEDDDEASQALNAGARGILLRDALGDTLLSALIAVGSGLTVFSAALASKLGDGSMGDGSTTTPRADHAGDLSVEPLTAREQQVIGLLAEGLSNRQIARRLDVTEHTAKFHTARILDKLDADSRTEAVVRAIRYGLVSV